MRQPQFRCLISVLRITTLAAAAAAAAAPATAGDLTVSTQAAQDIFDLIDSTHIVVSAPPSHGVLGMVSKELGSISCDQILPVDPAQPKPVECRIQNVDLSVRINANGAEMKSAATISAAQFLYDLLPASAITYTSGDFEAKQIGTIHCEKLLKTQYQCSIEIE